MYDYESNPEAKGVEYQVTKVDPTDPETKGMVYQVHKVSEEVAATLGGKVYRARIINDPTDPTVAGKVYQIVLIGDPEDPAVKGKVYNAILTGGSEAVIVGPAVSPLALPDAIANSLSYVKAFGGTEQNGTPTPDTPVDIVSNNGVLKVRHQSGLPVGYTLLDYIESTGTQYINTGYIPTSDIVEYGIEIYGTPSNGSSLFGAQASSDNSRYTGVPFTSGVTTKVYIGITASLASVFVPGNQWNKYVLQTTSSTAGKVTLNGVDTDFTYSAGIMKTLKVYLFANNQNNSATQLLSNQVKSFYIKDNGTLVRNFVPVKQGTTVGMYDTVSGQFFTNQGTGNFVAGDPVDDPAEIYTDGTVETINAHGKNLLPPANIEENIATYYTDFPTNSRVGYHMSLKAGTYTFSVGSEESTTYLRYKYNGQEWSAYASIRNNGTTQTYTNDVEIAIYSGSSGNNIENMLGRNVQVEQGSTATEYAPYYDGGTATSEMLLKVGDYQDEQEILSGAVTRNVGVKVLDGTENITTDTYGGYRRFVFQDSVGSYSETQEVVCSHYVFRPTGSREQPNSIYLASSGKFAIYISAEQSFSTVQQFGQWLADQYAAGTPVIVVYPLATPTTESVAGQTLQVTDGDNTLEITQASLDGLELEAQYNAAVSLTIQEVEDANLDNNVTVTIQ